MEYKNPAATVDIIFERDNEILLIERKHDPYQGCWALPGGHLDYGKETLEEAAVRESLEETSLKVSEKDLRLVGVYSAPHRDPRGHYITHVYVAEQFSGELQAADDASDARFFPYDSLPPLAFDHEKIIADYLFFKKT